MITWTSAGLLVGFVILMNVFTVLLNRLVDLLKDKRPTASQVLAILAKVTKAFGLYFSVLFLLSIVIWVFNCQPACAQVVQLTGDITKSMPITKSKCATLRDKLLKEYLDQDPTLFRAYYTLPPSSGTFATYQEVLPVTPKSLRKQADELEKKEAEELKEKAKYDQFRKLRDSYLAAGCDK